MPLPHINPDWFYVSDTGLPRLSWKTGVVLVAPDAKKLSQNLHLGIMRTSLVSMGHFRGIS